jgi:HEAT repeat protein
MHLRLLCLILAIALSLSASSSTAAQSEPSLEDELVLKGAGLGADGPGLLDFFRQRSQSRVSAVHLAQLARQLGDPSPATRARAAAEMIALGPAAVPMLRQVVKDPDNAEAAALARRGLEYLAGDRSSSLPLAAARLLAARQPPGTVAVLLAYLPFADNEAVLEEVKATLAAVAYRNGKADPELIRALDDPLSLRRAVAIDVLCETGSAEPRAALRKLLDDARPLVRLRAAVALAAVKEEKAIPTLIGLLAELPPAYARQAQESLANVAPEEAAKIPLGDTATARARCSAAWSAWWKSSDGPGLVEEFRKRTLKDADREKAISLVEKLGDADFDVREKAESDLETMGAAAGSVLRQAVANPDVEISVRAKKLVEKLPPDRSTPLSPISARLVAFRKPPAAALALLAFLPSAEDEATREEVRAALKAVAYRDGQPEPALLQALQDRSALRRWSAVEALCQLGPSVPLAAVRPLLQDLDPLVRLRTALALALILDRDAIPVLIAVLAELPSEQTVAAEEYLHHLAGEQAPPTVAGDEPADRRKRRDSWAAWWKTHGGQIELTVAPRAPRPRYYGYTLVVLNQSGQVLEVGPDYKPRWQLSGLVTPMDAQVLANDHVLVAEYNANRVTERTLKNEVVWEKRITWPVGCERLPNGNTFLVGRNQLVEVNREGKEVFTLNRNNFNDIMAARRLRDGQIILVSARNLILRLDTAGKEVHSYQVPNAGATNGIDILPNGNVLLPMPWNGNRVAEYNRDGKVVGEWTAMQPMAASRAPNGNTLVATQVWPPRILEMDRKGKIVWEYQPPNHAIRAKRR